MGPLLCMPKVLGSAPQRGKACSQAEKDPSLPTKAPESCCSQRSFRSALLWLDSARLLPAPAETKSGLRNQEQKG